MRLFSLRALPGLVLTVLLVACGGGSSAPPVDPVQAPSPTAPVPDPTPVPEPVPEPVPDVPPVPVPMPVPAPEPDPPPASNPAPDPAPVPDPITVSAVLTPLVAGTNGSAQFFPAGGSGTGAPIAGIGCATNEHYHIHAMISFYKDGIRLGIPAHIGLNGCTYETHTHDPTTGVVHIETDVAKTFVLGQFFALWGQDLSRSSAAGIAGPVRFYTIDDGVLSWYAGDPAQIVLAAHREVLIVAGTAPATVPRYDWAATGL